MKKYAQIALVLTLFLSNASQNEAQNLLQDTLTKQFSAYQQAHLQEKIYVHTDRTTYLAGDICWFKLYNVEAFFHTPLSISKIMYVEILDKTNKPVLQAKISMQNSTGNGSFFLPASMPSGNYKLRAYSNWMKNYGCDYFFEKTLTVINPKTIYEADSTQQKEQYQLVFFPEGGNLVEGIESKVAFRLTHQNGKGIEGEGIVINDKNDTIVTLKTRQFGIGSFVFTPKFNEKYKAIVTFSNGRRLTQALPDAYASGYVMHLEGVKNQTLKITVKATATHGSQVYLFAHTRGVAKSTSIGIIQDGEAIFLVDKNKLGDGISHFTVFSESQKPVCERLYFKYPKDYLQIDIDLNARIYGLRQKIDVEIHAANRDGKRQSVDMSMAVYALDSLQNRDEMDINNYLWLTSDLVGNIESPSFYCQNESVETTEDMDNLMLTHGWRRFKWDNILQNQGKNQSQTAFSFLPEYVGHLVTGTIKNVSTGQNASNTEGYLTTPDAKKQLHTTTSSQTGQFRFDIKDFYHNGRIILQAKGASDSTYSIKINNPFSEQYTHHSLPNFVLSAINPMDLQQQNVKLQVQNAYFSQKIKQTHDPKLDTTPFYRQPDARYLLDDYVRFLTLEEVLREYVVPINVRKTNNRFHLHVWDEYTKKFFDDTPLVLLDGLPILDMHKFMSYDPLKIKRLDVVSRQYFLNNKAYQGVLNFSTYTNSLTDFEFDPNTVVMDYNGLQKQRIFYAPDYATQQQVASRLPDFRHLLHWSPTIKTDEKGKTQAHFYSSDRTGKYIVVVQGLTKEGKTGKQIRMFEVKK